MGEMKWATVTHPVSVALCQPSVRMMAVDVRVDDDGVSGHRVYPVVAIQAEVQRRFEKGYEGNNCPYEYGNERELRRMGWRLKAQETYTAALIVNDDHRLFPIYAYQRLGAMLAGAQWSLVCCPWPAEEDDVRLAPIVAELKAKTEAWLREKRQAKKAQPAPPGR
jgi:hypothetical protein